MTGTHLSPKVISQMQEDAKTMTCKQMAEKHGVSPQAMRDRLIRYDIEFQRTRSNWATRLEELKTLAPHMSPRQLAEHFELKTEYVYTLLQRLDIKAAASRWPARFKGGLEALQKQAPTMTVSELAAHYGIDRRTVLKNLKRLGIECKSVEPAPKAPTKRKVANAKPPTPRAAPCPKKAAKPAPKFVQKPAPVLLQPAAPKPALKREVQIIVPADVKVTIVGFCPPPGMRICNGSSTQIYKPNARTGSVRSSY